MDEILGGADASERRHSSAHVLIVEDDPGYRSLLRCGLELEGDADYLVDTAGRLDEALERIARHRPDAIVLDLDLPDSRSGDTVHGVDHAAPEIPIVVVTGRDGAHVERSDPASAPLIVLDKHRVTPFDVFRAVRALSAVGARTPVLV